MNEGAIWPTGHSRLWCVVGTIAWELCYPGSGFHLIVPDGFVTDLASVPPFAQGLLNPFEPDTVLPAIVHDAMLDQGFDRHVAAAEFRRALLATNVPSWKRSLFYLVVLVTA